MIVNFYSFSKRINSTKRPTGNGTPVDCQIKEPCNISNPTLILTTGYLSVNYAYIGKWDRYYFVNDISVQTGGIIEMHLSCDVLATCRDYISSYSCFVERSASSYNNMFDDEYVSNSEDIIFRQSAETDTGSGLSHEGCYLIRTVSAGSDGTGVTTFAVNEAGMKSFLQKLFDPTRYGFLSDEVVKSFFNPFQYVVSVNWLPVSLRSVAGAAGSEKTAHMWAGWWDTGETGYIPAADGVTVEGTINVPGSHYDDFRRISNRFSHYNIFLPCVGTLDLGAEDAQSGLSYTLNIDILTGYGQYILKSGTGRVATFKCQMGVPIQIGQLNSGLLNMVSAGSGSLVSAASGNIAGAAGGLVNAAKSAFNPTMSINGANGDKYTFTSNFHIIVAVEQRDSGDIPTSVTGRPCYATKQLGTLTDFVKCGNASIDLPYFENEKEAVNNYLNSGFYME